MTSKKKNRNRGRGPSKPQDTRRWELSKCCPLEKKGTKVKELNVCVSAIVNFKHNGYNRTTL